MQSRVSFFLLAAALSACSGPNHEQQDVSSTDARDDVRVEDAPSPRDTAEDADRDAGPADVILRGSPAKVRVATGATLHGTAMLRTPSRLFAATLWSERASPNTTVSLHAFDSDGTRPTRVGSLQFRAENTALSLAPSAVALSGDRVAVVLTRPAAHGGRAELAPATSIVVLAANDTSRSPTAPDTAGAPGLLHAITSKRFAPSVTATMDGFLVLDMTHERRLRLTRIDHAGSPRDERLFELPFTVASEDDVRHWAVRAWGESFVVATNDERARLLVVSARGIENATARIQAISRVTSRPLLCVGDEDELEFAQSAENSATLWALHRSPARALRSVPLEEQRQLRACARPGLWLRTPLVATTASRADLWDADASRSLCANALRPANDQVARTLDLAGAIAIATDVEDDTIDLRPVRLDECIAQP